MKGILISLKPQFADLVMQGKKTFELRRRLPKTISRGDQIVIYESAPTSAITGSVTVSEVVRFDLGDLPNEVADGAGVTRDFLHRYFRGLQHGFAIGLTNPTLVSLRIPLAYLRAQGITPPQSFMYISRELQDILRKVANGSN